MKTAFDSISNKLQTEHKESYAAWLQYTKIEDVLILEEYQQFARSIDILTDSEVVNSAKKELIRGISSMLGFQPRISAEQTHQGSIVIGSAEALTHVKPFLHYLEPWEKPIR